MQTETVSKVSGLIDAFLTQVDELARTDQRALFFNFEPSRLEAGRAVLALSREEQKQFVLEALDRQVHLINEGNPSNGRSRSVLEFLTQQFLTASGQDPSGFRQLLGNHVPGGCSSLELQALVSAVLRKKLPFTAGDVERLVRTISTVSRPGWWEGVSPAAVLHVVEGHMAAEGLQPSLREALEQLAARFREHWNYAERPRKLLARVETLLKQTDATGGGAGSSRVRLRTDEAWTRRLGVALADLDAPSGERWDALLAHCSSATASRPSGKWLREAQSLVEALGTDSFVTLTSAVLAEVGKPGAVKQAPPNALGFLADPTQVHDEHSDLLRGLVWCTGLVEDEGLTSAVGDAAEVCFKKLPGIGPRAPKIGNACLWALGNLSSTAAVARLSRLKVRAKHASTQAQLAKAMGCAADKAGMSPEDLEEVAVPVCGLTAVGEHRQQLGDVTAWLRLTDGCRAEVSWVKADGKAQASAPASVKEGFAAELKAIRGMEREIEKLLPAQRDRLEQLLLRRRDWAFRDFRTRFLDHPLVGFVARRLIWRFAGDGREGEGICHDGRIVDEQGRPLDWVGDATRVSLWHPLGCPVQRVLAWRDRLEAQEVRQPFKQAHREVYVLTDAEVQTGAYSNRFAGHLLRQHQFNALCRQRGWRYTLQGEWDSANTPTLELPQWGLRAEFWVEPIRERGSLFERGDVSHRFIFLYVSTDQVRFSRLHSHVRVPLADVPPVVFSEVMRDVDLFVGVASIGNDPDWADGGLLGRARDYWENFSFGELFPTAQTRKAILERVIPRLKIAGRCSFTDRFLVVRGDLGTYRIHLGSGNILMEPGRYLCVVPKQGAASGAGKVYLPFEGDDLLSVIISKALLLAEDRKIKDPTIRRQIELLAAASPNGPGRLESPA